MMRAMAGIGLAAFLLTGCAHDGSITSTVPKAEKRLRKRQCDTLENSFRPSRNQDGHIELFGISIGARSATENRNSATSEYLFALNQMLMSCRDWQKYEISSQEFRSAQAELARAAQGSLKGNDALQLLRKVANAFEDANQGRDASKDEVTQRLIEIQTALDRPPTESTNWTGALQALVARFDQVDQRFESLDLRMANVEKLMTQGGSQSSCGARTQWNLLFGKGSSEPNPERLIAVMGEVQITLSSSPRSRVSIIGFADRTGDDTANLRLARKRAAQVARALLTAGIPVEIEAAEGSTARLGANPASNRAVVVSVSC